MSCRRELRALFGFALLGWRAAAAGRVALAGRALLYLVILAIFWQLWKATPLGELPPPAPTAEQLLWYLAITEWIVFAAGMPYREVEAEIRSGEIASALLRPLPYARTTLARWAGATGFHAVALALVGFAGAWWLTGHVLLTWAMAPGIGVAGLAAIALILLCHLQLGYVAAWTRSAAPAFWIWQKLAFVLGGLLMPLTLYPPPWGEAAALTPFASMLFAPASLAVDPRLPHLAAVLGGEAVWLAVLAASTIWLGRLATRRFLEHGV